MKKIDNSILEKIKRICYEGVLYEFINQESRNCVKELTRVFLDINGYKQNNIKCDEENNDVYMVDSGHIKLEIFEEDLYDSKLIKIHTIIL